MCCCSMTQAFLRTGDQSITHVVIVKTGEMGEMKIRNGKDKKLIWDRYYCRESQSKSKSISFMNLPGSDQNENSGIFPCSHISNFT